MMQRWVGGKYDEEEGWREVWWRGRLDRRMRKMREIWRKHEGIEEEDDGETIMKIKIKDGNLPHKR